MDNRIFVITTGGTIDGADSDKKTARHSSDAVKWLIENKNLSILHKPLINKDSREITSRDCNLIIEEIFNSQEEVVLVTHGTFTICDSGRAIKQAAQKNKSKKSIVMVGSWIPFGEENSDAPSQMEFALRVLKEKRCGVVIAMDGELWDPDTTEKIESGEGGYKLGTVKKI